MFLSPDAVENLARFLVLLYCLVVLLALNQVRLKRRLRATEDWAAQGFRELGGRVGYLERELERVLAHNNLPPLPQSGDVTSVAGGEAVR